MIMVHHWDQVCKLTTEGESSSIFMARRWILIDFNAFSLRSILKRNGLLAQSAQEAMRVSLPSRE